MGRIKGDRALVVDGVKEGDEFAGSELRSSKSNTSELTNEVVTTRVKSVGGFFFDIN